MIRIVSAFWSYTRSSEDSSVELVDRRDARPDTESFLVGDNLPLLFAGVTAVGAAKDAAKGTANDATASAAEVVVCSAAADPSVEEVEDVLGRPSASMMSVAEDS